MVTENADVQNKSSVLVALREGGVDDPGQTKQGGSLRPPGLRGE